MSTVFDGIDAKLERWLLKQSVFFVGTAPLAGDGHINLSPKGMAGTFMVFGENQVGYLDYTGSGAETIAHLRENGRVTIMFCAFEGPPKIVRLYGRGRTVLVDDPEFAPLRSRFSKAETKGQRAIMLVDVDRVADSCGFSVPTLTYVSDRDVLDQYHDRRDEAFTRKYWREKNAESIDGLPAI